MYDLIGIWMQAIRGHVCRGLFDPSAQLVYLGDAIFTYGLMRNSRAPGKCHDYTLPYAIISYFIESIFLLQREEDVAYLRDNLMCGEVSVHSRYSVLIAYIYVDIFLRQTDATASQRLRETIAQCLHTRTTQLNDAVHLLRHA